MHFAAYAYVGESTTKPGKYYRNNVVGSLALIEAMRDHGINNIVFSSTCATYGIPDRMPIDEDTAQSPINPYGRSKLMVERMLADFEIAHGLNWIALRYFNAAGADPDNRIGEAHDPETHLIPLVLDAASGRMDSVTIFGNDYDTADGTCIRDYVHVSDLAAAHVKALDALVSGTASGPFNLGNGMGYSVRQIIDTATVETGLKINARLGDRREGNPAALISDASRAYDILHWKPEYPDIADIIASARAWAWHQKQSAFPKAEAV